MDDIDREERALYAIAAVVLAPVVIVAVMSRVSFDGAPTLCLLVVVLALVGLAATLRRRRSRLPRARIHARPGRTPPERRRANQLLP